MSNLFLDVRYALDLSCVLALSLDPMFFYIPVIHDDKKCLGLDKKLEATSIALCSIMISIL